MTTFFSWADEYAVAHQVADLARDPNGFKITRQTKVTIAGALVPVSANDALSLQYLFVAHLATFRYYRDRCGKAPTDLLTATMEAALRRAGERAKGPSFTSGPFGYTHISLDPRDYTLFMAPHVPLVVVSIHTRPERCWFLGINLPFEALTMNLGRMRVNKPENGGGVYPITVRTKWRALTSKVKQREVRDAYQRLLKAK